MENKLEEIINSIKETNRLLMALCQMIICEHTKHLPKSEIKKCTECGIRYEKDLDGK